MNNIEQYYNIHCLVQKYQSNRNKYSTDLILAFSNFLNKYLKFFKLERPNMILKNLDIKHLVCLYSHCKFVKTNLNINKTLNKNLIKASCKLIDLVNRDLEYDELVSIITIGFLSCAVNYKDIRPSFHNHVVNNICYRIYESMSVCFKSKKEVEFTDELDFIDYNNYYNYDKSLEYIKNKRSVSESLYNFIPGQKSNNVYSNDFFDTKWFNGITCTYPFTTLTPFERRIIKMYYVDNMMDKEIASVFGLHCLYIMRRRNKAIDKLKLCYKI